IRMTAWSQIDAGRLVLFALVLARTSGVVMSSPVFGSKEVPLKIRALMALALALLLLPGQWHASTPDVDSTVELAVAAAGELVIGLALGFGVMLLFAGVQLAGQLISQISGISLADVFNPNFDAAVPLFSELLYLCSLAVFVLMGGHRMVLEALLQTFEVVPIG